MLPINILNVGGDYAAGRVETYGITGTLSMSHLSVANVTQGSSGLWAHALSVYVFSALALWLIIWYWRYFVPLRYYFLANTTSITRRTVLVVNIPKHLCTGRALMHTAKELYGDSEVESVCLATKAGASASAVAERERLNCTTPTPASPTCHR